MLKHKKILLGSLALLVLCICIRVEGWHALYGLSVLAADEPNMFQATAELAVIITTAMETFAFLIFHFLVGLLDPLFVMGISETEALRNIWKYSRDIVNIIFAFMLIAAGIYTVVTGNKEIVQQKYKSFIIAVILVNFSWFFPRVIFDVANVLTATIYQLPAGLSGDAVDCKMPPEKDGEEGKPCQVIIDVKYFTGCNPPPDGYIDKLGIVCYKTEDWKKDTNNAFGMLNGLVMNYGKLPDLTRVLNPDVGGGGGDGTPEEQLKEYLLFLIHIIFVLVLMAMLFLPLAAMFVVFLIRIPIIWLTISFMPFMFLGFVMGDKMGQFDTMKIFQHFVKAAFLPAAVAVPFAAGFLILTQVTQIKCEDTVADGFRWCADTGPILLNVHTLWGLMMLFIGFFVIWSGFWAALKIDDIYVNMTNGIKSFGESIGKTALKLPFSIPILPVGDKGMSILGIDDKLRNFSSGLSAGKGPGEALGMGDNNELGKALSKSDGKTNMELTKILNELKKNKPGQFNDGGLRKEIADLLNAPGDNALKIALKADGLDPKKVSTEDIMNKIGSSGGPLADLVKDMRKPPKKEEGGAP